MKGRNRDLAHVRLDFGEFHLVYTILYHQYIYHLGIFEADKAKRKEAKDF